MSAKKFENLQKKLKIARAQSGLTQRQLAKKIGVSLRTISNLEQGIVKDPRGKTLETILKFIEIAEQSDSRDNFSSEGNHRLNALVDELKKRVEKYEKQFDHLDTDAVSVANLIMHLTPEQRKKVVRKVIVLVGQMQSDSM